MHLSPTLIIDHTSALCQQPAPPWLLHPLDRPAWDCSLHALPRPALTLAPHRMGQSMMAMYKGFEAARARDDFSTLPELHALSSGLKAL